MIWIYHIGICVLLAGCSHCTPSCKDYLENITQNMEYEVMTKQLSFPNTLFVNQTWRKCSSEKRQETELVVELVAVHDSNSSAADDCCRDPCDFTRVQNQVYLSKVLSEPNFAFQYVEGDYFLRYRHCSCSSGYCFRCKTRLCSNKVIKLGESSSFEPEADCGNASLSYLTKFTRFSFKDGGLEDNCTVEITAVFPSCSMILPYTKADIQIFQVDRNDSCPDSFQGLDKYHSAQVQVKNCNSSLCPSYDNLYDTFGFVNHRFDARTNASYCVLIEQESPACEVNPGLCSVYYYTPVHCIYREGPVRGVFPLSEPLFIGCVCAVLFLSLLLLLWTVVKCKKEQTSPNPSPEPELIKDKKNIPRSLTIDEMEHICRLRHQELVLVYFPDTEPFKELNRLFKNWLLSLTTLNVNDVTDVYDEKYSDGPDGVLKNPDGWVANLLSDPERRVILVTSKLAYECLIHIRKGLAPPSFPSSQTHSEMLFSILKFLDSEMFHGNYRRLICVRYEDLKICDRRYGSESFNIVPGTEYLLPQHLEDIARWVHPVEAKPSLWADHRPQVEHLFNTLRQYRHQEDNIFTVSFYDGENGALLGHHFKNGF